MALRTSLQTVVTATAAEATIGAKTTACIPPLLDAVMKEVTLTIGLTPNQMEKFTVLRAEVVTNIADFATALTV